MLHAHVPTRPAVQRGRVFRRVKSLPHAVVAPSVTADAAEATQLVNNILTEIENTDSGLAMTPGQRTFVDQCIDRLEAIGATQQPRPNKNELLWGNYTVAYTSTARSMDPGQPAGGRFRGGLRWLFRTAGLFQSVLQPDLCTNKVRFRLLGLISGEVGLRGKVYPLTHVGDDDTVRVRFEPTSLSFGPLHFSLGSPSEVQLTTTYLDERVRLGKGSRGSLFVFTRGGEADTVGMDQVGAQVTPAPVMALAVAGYVAAMLGALALFLTNTHPVLRAVTSFCLFVGGLIPLALRNGGQLNLERQQRLMRKREADEAAVATAAAAPQAPPGGAGGTTPAPAAASS